MQFYLQKIWTSLVYKKMLITVDQAVVHQAHQMEHSEAIHPRDLAQLHKRAKSLHPTLNQRGTIT